MEALFISNVFWHIVNIALHREFRATLYWWQSYNVKKRALKAEWDWIKLAQNHTQWHIYSRLILCD